MEAHAKLSASGSHRWMSCPASVMLEEQFPDETNEYAAEGTAAHDIASQCLTQGLNASAFLGGEVEADGFVFMVDDAFADHVQAYLDFVRALPGRLMVEQRVSFSDHVPEGFGTADAIVIGDDGHCYVVDLKFGKGQNVSVERNTQAMLYALGVLQTFGFIYEITDLTLVIHQPRIDGVSEWHVSTAELMEWAETELKSAVDAVSQDEPVYNPGADQCKFCKAKGSCPALTNHMQEVARAGFEAVGAPIKDYPLDQPLSIEDIAAILPYADLLKDWLKEIGGRAFAAASAGETVPGYKLVRGSTKRAWTNHEELFAALKKTRQPIDTVLPRKPMTITAAENLLGKDHKIIKTFAVAPEPPLKLTPESDSKPAVVIDRKQGFEPVAA